MKLKTRLMLFTAATALSANMAFAAINAQALADAYLAEGYTYVEVKTGPTQTKLEAVKGDSKVEVVYDNTTGGIIKQELEDADDDYIGRTGVEIEGTDDDFVGGDDGVGGGDDGVGGGGDDGVGGGDDGNGGGGDDGGGGGDDGGGGGDDDGDDDDN